jgi:hypothetical protein
MTLRAAFWTAAIWTAAAVALMVGANLFVASYYPVRAGAWRCAVLTGEPVDEFCWRE